MGLSFVCVCVSVFVSVCVCCVCVRARVHSIHCPGFPSCSVSSLDALGFYNCGELSGAR